MVYMFGQMEENMKGFGHTESKLIVYLFILLIY